MIQLKKLHVFLILSYLIIACTSIKQVKRTPPFNFAGTVLSKGINKKGNTGIPEKPTSTFTSEDVEVIAHVKVENLSGRHKLLWDWYDPEGNLYCSLFIPILIK